jgi:hypothetical protein
MRYNMDESDENGMQRFSLSVRSIDNIWEN